MCELTFTADNWRSLLRRHLANVPLHPDFTSIHDRGVLIGTVEYEMLTVAEEYLRDIVGISGNAHAIEREAARFAQALCHFALRINPLFVQQWLVAKLNRAMAELEREAAEEMTCDQR